MSLFPPAGQFDTPGLNIGIDLNRDNFICWEAEEGDALNEVESRWGLDPLDYSTGWKTTTIVSGVTITKEDYASLYGSMYIKAVCDTTNSNGMIIGKDGFSTFNFTGLTNGLVYTAIMWIKRDGATSASRPMRLQVRTQSDGSTKSNTDFDLLVPDIWYPLLVSFTANGTDSNVCFRIFKNGLVGTAITFYVSGIMLFEMGSAVAQQGYNTGVNTDLYENIKRRVIAADSFIGMRPYQKIGDENQATITCYNRDQFFSQEYTSSPAYGTLLPYTRLQIRYDSNWYYTGYIEKCAASPFKYGDNRAVITCFGLKRYLESAPANLEYAESQRVDEYLTQVLLDFDSTLDTSAIQQAQTTLAYYGDNAYDNEELKLSVYDACKQLVWLEQGWFFINAQGQPEFFDRHETVGVVSGFTIDNTAQEIDYAAFGEFLINKCTVKAYPRKISASATDLLWALDQNQTVAAGNIRRFRVAYTDTNYNRCGAKDVATPAGADFVTSGGSPFLYINIYGQFARLSVDNLTGLTPCVISTLNVKGRSITYLNPIETIAENATSITNYGLREMVLDMKGLSNINEAEDLANFVILTRSQLRGDVKSVTLVSHQDSDEADDQRAIEIGSVITVIDDQLSHEGIYFVVGVAHNYAENGMLRSKYNLEIIAASQFWVLGESELDTTTVLGY